MWTVLAFLLGLFIGVLMSALAFAADDENDMIYKEGYLEGYSDGKEARKDNDNSGNET